VRCVGAGSADRVLFLLLEERRGVDGCGVGGDLGPIRGRGTVPLGQALGCVAEDGQGLRDGVKAGSLIQGIKTYGLLRLKRSLGNLGSRGGSGTS